MTFQYACRKLQRSKDLEPAVSYSLIQNRKSMFLNLYISVICICFGFRTSDFEFMRDTLHHSRFTRMRYELRKITYEIISVLCKTNPILSAVGGFQMNVNIYYTKAYNNETAFRRGKNKPNSNPIKPCPERSRMGQFLQRPKSLAGKPGHNPKAKGGTFLLIFRS